MSDARPAGIFFFFFAQFRLRTQVGAVPAFSELFLIELVPVTQRHARRWCNDVHRHLSAPRGDLFRVALSVNGEIQAIGIAGRPTRLLQDGRTAEITRIASSAPSGINACSRLYGALIRAGQALGYRRFITYTLESESGISPKAAGFAFDGLTRADDWVRPNRKRRAAEQPGPKQRWIYPGRESGLWG